MKLMVIFVLSLILSLGYAQNITVEATGYGLTEAQAKADALRNAVEQGAGVKIFSQTEVQNFVALKDIIISESFGWVTGYTVLSSLKKGPQDYEVRVQATVTKDVNADWAKIKLLIQANGNPKIMFCIRETLDGQEITPSSGELKLVQKFKDAGFEVIDRQMAQETQNLQKQVNEMDQNLQNVIAIVSKRNADILISGTFDGKFARMIDTYGLKKIIHNYNFNLKIVNIDNASIDGALTQTYITNRDAMLFSREGAGTAGFAEITGEKYVQPLMANLIKSWVKKVMEGCELTVVISGIKYAQRKQIIESLTGYTEVISSVQVEHFRNGRLQLRVKAKISIDEVAEKLEENLPLEVVEAQKNTLELKYIGN